MPSIRRAASTAAHAILPRSWPPSTIRSWPSPPRTPDRAPSPVAPFRRTAKPKATCARSSPCTSPGSRLPWLRTPSRSLFLPGAEPVHAHDGVAGRVIGGALAAGNHGRPLAEKSPLWRQRHAHDRHPPARYTLEMDVLSLLASLASSVPPPKLHLVRYGGVLAPAPPCRPLVIPPLCLPNCDWLLGVDYLEAVVIRLRPAHHVVPELGGLVERLGQESIARGIVRPIVTTPLIRVGDPFVGKHEHSSFSRDLSHQPIVDNRVIRRRGGYVGIRGCADGTAPIDSDHRNAEAEIRDHGIASVPFSQLIRIATPITHLVALCVHDLARR